MKTPLIGALLILTSAVACTTTVETAPPGLSQAVIQSIPPARAWRVLDGSRTVGSVVRYEEMGGAQRFFYSVRNVHDQDMGMVDEQGRAFRYRPHSDPEWLGSGTVREGVVRILALSTEATIEEVSLSELNGVSAD